MGVDGKNLEIGTLYLDEALEIFTKLHSQLPGDLEVIFQVIHERSLVYKIEVINNIFQHTMQCLLLFLGN